MHLTIDDFDWESDNGIDGGAWLALSACAKSNGAEPDLRLPDDQDMYAVIQPLHDDGTPFVDEMEEPDEWGKLAAWWFDNKRDAFLDPGTFKQIRANLDFEVDDAPTFDNLERAMAAFEHGLGAGQAYGSTWIDQEAQSIATEPTKYLFLGNTLFMVSSADSRMR